MKIRRQFRAPRQAHTGGDRPSRAARMLALAHHIERLVDGGSLESYAEAAEALGLTRARVTQLMNLLLLSPRVQEAILTSSLIDSERSLRTVLAQPHWPSQVQTGTGNSGVELSPLPPGRHEQANSQLPPKGQR